MLVRGVDLLRTFFYYPFQRGMISLLITFAMVARYDVMWMHHDVAKL